MATSKEISDFLISVERRAFKHAHYLVQNDAVAHDVVQEAMLKLVQHYSAKPPNELPMLFQRILQNTINDHFRRSKVQNLWTTLLSSFQGAGDDDDFDLLETLPVEPISKSLEAPDLQLESLQLIENIEEGLKELPPRQREAFLLRYWEEMDVATTAKIMGCSEGSVKTHCSRAAHALARWLKKND